MHFKHEHYKTTKYAWQILLLFYDLRVSSILNYYELKCRSLQKIVVKWFETYEANVNIISKHK